jgi:hypothetical protein
MEAGKNSVIYMGLISGPNKADDTCGRTTVTGTMHRGFTVFAPKTCSPLKSPAYNNESFSYCNFLICISCPQ